MSHEIEPEFGTSEWCRYALSFHLQTGRCSEGLVGQLAAGLWSRDLDFHSIVNQIGALDGSENPRSANTKPAEQFRRGQLKGLMHKHFFQPSHILRNAVDHWFDAKREKSPKLDKIFERTIADDFIPSDRKMDYVLHEFVIGGYVNRSREHRLTGDWIIYKPHNGISCYLTLASHSEKEEGIVARVKDCFQGFSELAPVLNLT